MFKEEIPTGRRSSFGWFLAGLVLYATLLAAVTALNEKAAVHPSLLSACD